ncbi:hypothetical protein MUY14_04060 [Amycolatopsis sp. FBCC-B4732]|nr:hypothetical protein [Amycolatopsis sp. FBCC-B4732]UOX89822.1 hypothetical protein MUY14_04060 [Amycolatopsis sp. FBCC-B4732]
MAGTVHTELAVRVRPRRSRTAIAALTGVVARYGPDAQVRPHQAVSSTHV